MCFASHSHRWPFSPFSESWHWHEIHESLYQQVRTIRGQLIQMHTNTFVSWPHHNKDPKPLSLRNDTRLRAQHDLSSLRFCWREIWILRRWHKKWLLNEVGSFNFLLESTRGLQLSCTHVSGALKWLPPPLTIRPWPVWCLNRLG